MEAQLKRTRNKKCYVDFSILTMTLTVWLVRPIETTNSNARGCWWLGGFEPIRGYNYEHSVSSMLADPLQASSESLKVVNLHPKYLRNTGSSSIWGVRNIIILPNFRRIGPVDAPTTVASSPTEKLFTYRNPNSPRCEIPGNRGFINIGDVFVTSWTETFFDNDRRL